MKNHREKLRLIQLHIIIIVNFFSIIKLHEVGIISHYKRKWLSKGIPDSETRDEFKNILLEDVSSIFFIYFCGVLISLGIFLIEIHHHRSLNNRNKWKFQKPRKIKKVEGRNVRKKYRRTNYANKFKIFYQSELNMRNIY